MMKKTVRDEVHRPNEDYHEDVYEVAAFENERGEEASMADYYSTEEETDSRDCTNNLPCASDNSNELQPANVMSGIIDKLIRACSEERSKQMDDIRNLIEDCKSCARSIVKDRDKY